MVKGSKVVQKPQSQQDVWHLCNQAMLFELGLKGEPDLARAIELYQQAAALGSQYAQGKISEIAKNFPEKKLQLLNGTVGYDVLVEQGLDHDLDNLDQASAQHGNELKQKILIVDDSPDTVLIFKKILQSRDVRVLTASNGKEAFQEVREHPDIACVFVDLQMPEMNGFEFITLIRRMHMLEDIPIVVETAHTSRPLVKHGKAKGVSAWVMKPIEQEKILDLVDKLL
ncbi:response regulator [Pseudobacteriovorax antillogorgiicola]|uniref:CheY chemotaxis protein or a CheY-like REC (Receiver) domain n=1 Tax=Pseudobacteriovorax antillogorgiicola TaxID=1513793 RepID=A0A1Y6CJI5_9BACT|nr:response regulator [Pseudobacteriovorax antillogorgiicola]TCS46400.1 CheY-like chemotaxis protein [Pseudobacteriovorax antillogorgiicola]SMF68787.1 CheY chemotaxis protein or a CheY-like REC (receiver) domain [Pseudobacteriovorax antillogorgiicola]